MLSCNKKTWNTYSNETIASQRKETSRYDINEHRKNRNMHMKRDEIAITWNQKDPTKGAKKHIEKKRTQMIQ